MKKIFFLAVTLLLTAVFATNVQAQNKDEKATLQAAAASVTSDTPATDGVKNLLNFQNGDQTYAVNINSTRRVRKSAVKMAYELYKEGCVSYESYVKFAKSLAIKPRRA